MISQSWSLIDRKDMQKLVLDEKKRNIRLKRRIEEVVIEIDISSLILLHYMQASNRTEYRSF